MRTERLVMTQVLSHVFEHPLHQLVIGVYVPPSVSVSSIAVALAALILMAGTESEFNFEFNFEFNNDHNPSPPVRTHTLSDA